MNRYKKILLVLAGYGAALGTAVVAVYFENLRFQNQPGGMYAEGESLFFLAAWGFLSLFPTALALFFLRPYPRFWVFLTWASVAVAATAPLAEAMNTLLRIFKLVDPTWSLIGFFGLARVGVMPLLALAFTACAVIAPGKRARWIMAASAAAEAVTFAYVLTQFILWNRFA